MNFLSLYFSSAESCPSHVRGRLVNFLLAVTQGININPFKSDNQAEDMYDERKPHLFIKFADDRYLLQGISDGEHNFLLPFHDFLCMQIHSSAHFRSEYLTRV